MNDLEDAAGLAFYALGVAALFLFGLMAAAAVTMLAWNWSAPFLFGMPEATYRNAIGLTLLLWVSRLVRAKEA